MIKRSDKIIIKFQHFNGCPNGDSLLNNLKSAMIGFEDNIIFENIIVDTPELAKFHKFRGSPTILINNNDIENMIEPLNPNLSCRYYPKGLPSIEFIKNKIKEQFSL